MNAPAKEEAKDLVGAGIQRGWIKGPGSAAPARKGGISPAEADLPLTNEEARDRYLECWGRVREIELERLKLENEWLKERMLLRAFETTDRF